MVRIETGVKTVGGAVGVAKDGAYKRGGGGSATINTTIIKVLLLLLLNRGVVMRWHDVK